MSEAHYRNLAVPFLSQRKNNYVFTGKYNPGKEYDTNVKSWEQNNDLYLIYSTDTTSHIKRVSMANRSCNITCIAMILHYFGITNDTPDTMMERYFTSTDTYSTDFAYQSVMAFETWDNMYDFVEKTYEGLCTPKLYEYQLCTIDNLKENIAAGYPVMLSLGAITIGWTSGHIVVVRGFTKIDGDEYIIFNDPWGSSVNIHNELVRGTTVYAYYNDLLENNGANGDNLVLKVSEFKKLIVGGKTMHMAMVIYGPLWQYPNRTKIGTTDNEDIIKNKSSIIRGESFPIRNMSWHNGIHLTNFTSNEIHSIGSGRLLAVRNKDAINGSASFMLVQHQFAKIENSVVGELLPFYALYMHTACINIKACAKMYFETGRLPDAYNYKWLLQLFSNMLPHLYVIQNKDVVSMVLSDPDWNAMTKTRSATEVDTWNTTQGKVKERNGVATLYKESTSGQLNDTYNKQKIYKAEITDGQLMSRKDATDKKIDASEEFHGRRMLVHVLPVNDLFQKLLDPKNYSDPTFWRRMLEPNNFIKNVRILDPIKQIEVPHKYIFFHSYDASTDPSESTEEKIFCSQVFSDDFFIKPITVNKRVFERTAKKLSQLYNDGSETSGTVVSFDDLENLSVTGYIPPKDYLDSRANSFTFKGASSVNSFANLSKETIGFVKNPFIQEQQDHWNAIFTSRIAGDTPFPPTDNFFNAMVDISTDLATLHIDITDCGKTICEQLTSYFEKYKNSRCTKLKSFLDDLVKKTNEPDEPDEIVFLGYTDATTTDATTTDGATTDGATNDTDPTLAKNGWEWHLRNTLNNCFFEIQTYNGVESPETLFENLNLITRSGVNIANSFLTCLKKLDLPLGYAEIALEMACCRLCSIDKNKIEKSDDYFKTSDGSIDTLLIGYSDLLTEIFKSFNIDYQHYVDTIIEIPKDEIIGKCGVYDNKKMIHFEIFSAKDVNIYKKLDDAASARIIDLKSKLFFDPSHTMKIVEHVFEHVQKHVYILKEDESKKLDESTKLCNYAIEHISEWSPKLDCNFFKKNHKGDCIFYNIFPWNQNNRNTEPLCRCEIVASNALTTILTTEEYFNQCMIPYYWNLQTQRWKKDFPGDIQTFYHPIYFLQQIDKNDKKSFEIHNPKPETPTE